MNRPESFLHMVDGKQIGNTRQSVKKLILKSEQRCWPDYGGLRKQLSCDTFSFSLCVVSIESEQHLSSLTLVRKNSEGELGSALYEDK